MVIIISGSYTMQCFWYDRADWENSTIEELFPTSPLVMKQKWHFTERYRNAPFRTIQLTTTEEVLSDLELKIVIILTCTNLLSPLE